MERRRGGKGMGTCVHGFSVHDFVSQSVRRGERRKEKKKKKRMLNKNRRKKKRRIKRQTLPSEKQFPNLEHQKQGYG